MYAVTLRNHNYWYQILILKNNSNYTHRRNRRKGLSCSCRELSWKAHSVDAIVVYTNTHSIGSDCHWLFISGHEEITSDYR